MRVSKFLSATRKLEAAYEQMCRPICRDFGLSRTGFDILMFLSNNPELFTAKDISLYRNIRPNVISAHVDRLVSEGYLLRQPVDGDRRKLKLVCTRKADPVARAGRSMQKEFISFLTRGFTREELEAFHRDVTRLEENAEALARQVQKKEGAEC